MKKTLSILGLAGGILCSQAGELPPLPPGMVLKTNATPRVETKPAGKVKNPKPFPYDLKKKIVPKQLEPDHPRYPKSKLLNV